MSTDTREALAALMVIAAECAQRKPLRGFEELTEAIHIGHRQFGRAHEKADEDVRMLAVRLRAVFDTLAAALATQPAQPSALGAAHAVPNELTIKQIEEIAFAVLRSHNDDRLWRALTYESGPCDVTKATLALQDLAAAFFRAGLASAPAAPAQPSERERYAQIVEAEHVGQSLDDDTLLHGDITYNMALKHAAAAIREGAAPAAPAHLSPMYWLASHCRALGMVKKSDSGLIEHDIALFVADLKDAAAPAQPEPLNFDQLQRVMSQHFGGRELTDDEADSAEAFARAIERAHGIAPKAAQPQEKT